MTGTVPRWQSSDFVTLMMALVPFLLSSGPTTVQEAAAHFEVSEERIREAIEDLFQSGIADRDGHTYPDQMFDLDYELFEEHGEIVLTNAPGMTTTPLLAPHESAPVLAGLMLIKSSLALSDQASIDALMEKIRHVTVEAHAESIGVTQTPAPAANSTLADAISRGVQVSLDYRDAGGHLSHRVVDPYRIDLVSNEWFLRAWCHERNELRTFRTDRISQVKLRNDSIDHALGDVTISEDLFTKSDNDLLVSIQLPEWALGFVADYHPLSVESTEDHVVAVIRFGSINSVIRLIAQHPGVLRVTGPREVRSAVLQWAQRKP